MYYIAIRGLGSIAISFNIVSIERKTASEAIVASGGLGFGNRFSGDEGFGFRLGW